MLRRNGWIRATAEVGSTTNRVDGLPSPNLWSLPPSSTDVSTAEVGMEEVCHFLPRASAATERPGCSKADEQWAGLSIALMCGGRIANSSDRSRTAIPIVFAVTCGHQSVTPDDSACTCNQASMFVMTLLHPADFFDCSSKP